MNIKKGLILFLGIINFTFIQAQTTIRDSILYEGLWRNYRLFLPNGFNVNTQRPLVFNLHGYGSNALEQEIYSGFDAIADSADVIVCYPNGINNSWNAFDRIPDDVGFIDSLITLLHNEYNVNLNRIYSTGMSNGGFMSNYLACELTNRFAAIAPVAGTNSVLVQASCSPSRNIPVLYIHGTADATVLYEGSTLYSSANELMTLWSNVNGCSSNTDTVLLSDISLTDNCRAQKITWHDCNNSTQLIHYRIIDGGHTWPGSPILIGTTNQDINASGIIWNFFNQFSLTLSTENFESESDPIKISQNPFSSFIDIDLKSSSPSLIYIYSSDGKLIQSAKYSNNKIYLEEDHLNPGLYFLHIFQNNLSKTFKIVKIL